MERLLLEVAYDGRGFKGFAFQPAQRSVAGELLKALRRVLPEVGELVCAGRTDAGVHAWGQVVHVDVPENTDLAKLRASLNALLAPEIAVRGVSIASEGFHARYSAKKRHYRYALFSSTNPDPFLYGRAWYINEQVDMASMNLAADALLGEHDFSAFCRKPKDRHDEALIRRVLMARWSRARYPLVLMADAEDSLGRERQGELFYFDIMASSFCHQMVRSIVGTLVEIGKGKRKPGEMLTLLSSGDRSLAGPLAPPYGLYLAGVRY
ncbi:MAG: tRNA pseudouridine(38-40) synthase TruA [Actinobacteria bacterium]|nr:tRNA pseudouridine(38-40) synthase TruA [Actinomycetota bacterium]MCL6095818.1 tRNA pseudouridine(38-40) synthase TruA [Actinomycetota bacterium]